MGLVESLKESFAPYGYDAAAATVVEGASAKIPQIGEAIAAALKAYVAKPSTATRIDALVILSVVQTAMPEPKSAEEKSLIQILNALDRIRESLAAQQCEAAPAPAPEEKK